MKIRFAISPLLRALCVCSIATFASQAAQGVDFASSSVLSSGKWVKVKVTEEGIHQISYDELRQWGIDPAKATIYGCGGTGYTSNEFTANVVDDLAPIAAEHTPDGRILFYGCADLDYKFAYENSKNKLYIVPNRNLYATYGTYFITEGTAPQMSEVAYVERAVDVTTTHICANLIEEELTSPAVNGGFFFGRNFSSTVSPEYEFDVDNFASIGCSIETSSNVYNNYAMLNTYANFYTKSPNRVVISSIISGDLNTGGYNTGAAAVSSTSADRFHPGARCAYYNGAETGVVNGTYSVTYTTTDSELTFGAIDRVSVTYPRYNDLGYDTELQMYFMSTRKGYPFAVDGASSTTRVWNVSNPSKVFAYQGKDAGDGRYLYSFAENAYVDEPAHIIAFDASAQHRSVEFVGDVPNQNIHADATPDMVIITIPALESSARELAAAHKRLQGLDVNVYVQEQIFNEFSSGTPAAMGYRRLVKMFYDRDPQKMKYLLLYGGSSFDNRGLIYSNEGNLLAYNTELVGGMLADPTNYTTDAYYGMVGDDFRFANILSANQQVAVGRLALRLPGDATRINRKLINYLENPPSPQYFNRALMISDSGNENKHLLQSEEAAQAMRELSPSMSIERAALLAYSSSSGVTSQVKKSLTNGVGFFGFSGHSVIQAIGTGALWSQSQNSLLDYEVPPFAMLSTCETFPFQTGIVGLGEAMFNKEKGGAIGVIGACVPVYLEYNQLYNLSVAKAYAMSKPGDTFGDMLLRARGIMLKEYGRHDEAMTNSLCFNFCGDPAIAISAPALTAVVTAVNNEAVEADQQVEVYPGVPVVISGDILDAKGSVAEDFNGTVSLELFNTARVIEIPADPATDPAIQLSLDNERLALASGRVVNGKFTATIISPVSNRVDASNRLVIFAEPEADGVAASGIYTGLILKDLDVEQDGYLAEVAAPTIDAMFIDDETFADGQDVRSSFNLCARISAPGSIGVADRFVGTSSRLMLDGTRTYPYLSDAFTLQPDGVIEFSTPISGLSQGAHSLTLSVTDNFGQKAYRTISFVVTDAGVTGVLATTAAPARTEAEFTLEHSADLAQTQIVVEDAAGHTVFSAKDISFPYTWDLTDNDSNDVPEGNYTVSAAFVDTNGQHGSTPRIPLIVIR